MVLPPALPRPELGYAGTGWGQQLEVDVPARICESKQEGEWGAAAVFTQRLFIVVPQRLVLGTFNTFLLAAGSFWPGLDALQELAATAELSQVPGTGCQVKSPWGSLSSSFSSLHCFLNVCFAL